MFKATTLGSFFPGNTPVHRLDPRAKIILTLLYVIAVLKAANPLSLVLVLIWLFIGMYGADLTLTLVFKGLKGFIYIIVLVVLINIFLTPGDIILQWHFIKITDAGLKTAFLLLARIIMLVAGSAWLTYTTSPLQLMAGLEYLLRPIRFIGLNSHELAMMMIIALRFIPLLIVEMQKIIQAQRARGADFSGNVFRQTKYLLPLLTPLFLSAWQHGEELALAMESRCYRGGKGRTSLHVLTMSRGDWTVLTLGVLILAVICAK